MPAARSPFHISSRVALFALVLMLPQWRATSRLPWGDGMEHGGGLLLLPVSMEQKRIPFLWADGQLPRRRPYVHSIWRTVTRVRASPRETIVHGGGGVALHCTGPTATAIMERDH